MRVAPLLVLGATALAFACSDEARSSAPVDAGTEPIAPPPDATPTEPATRTLFIGNSHTFVNDLPAQYVRLATPSRPGHVAPFVESVTYGGYTLPLHLADLRGSGENPRVTSLLGPDAGTAQWNHVVLQENSIFQFGEHIGSVEAAIALSDSAAAAGATTVVYMTWGYANTNYAAMQASIEETQREAARAIASAGHPVVLAPAGLAFRAVYDREMALGHDPLAPGSPFMQLYNPDLMHASVAGTYVAACVVTAAMHDVDPTTFADDVAGLDTPTRLALQAIARDVVAKER